jgi:DNA-binding GntR family transcriptional regulator
MTMVRPKKQPLVRTSIAVQVADAIREMIHVGEVRPGENLTHEGLASELGVSTMPVREALLRLTHEGFISMSPNRSFSVVPITRGDVDDIYWVLEMLDGELVSRAAAHADPEFLAGLEAVAEEWERVADGDPMELDRLNVRFHNTIYEQARSPKLMLLLRNTIPLIPERFYAHVPRWRDLSTSGHRRLLEALRSGDSTKARLASERHIKDSYSVASELFSEEGYWSQGETGPKHKSKKR